MNSPLNSHLSLLIGGVSRRSALRGLGGAGVATALGLAPRDLCASTPSPAEMIEPEAGSWKTWVLTSGHQLRPAAPPDETATQQELVKLQEMVADGDAAALDRISYWDAGSPGYRWNELALQQTLGAQMGPNAYRMLALMNGAIYDG